MNTRNVFRFVLSLCLLPLIFLYVGVAQAAQSSCGNWSTVKSPNVGTGHNYLEAVAAVSTSDIWAVGSVYGYFPHAQTLIEHWDGESWQVVHSPKIASNQASFLHSVTAISANDVWAVGNYINSHNVTETLIEQWNGIKWQIVPSPNPGLHTNSLDAVAAVSASDIWAVGWYVTRNITRTLIEQWNGSQWQIVPNPNPGRATNSLDAVAAVSASDIWAVGSYGAKQVEQTLIEQWTGSQWTVMSSPSPGTFINELQGVAIVSPNDVWAVGVANGSLTEHWNGAIWQVVPSPNVYGASSLSGVAAVSANNIWAVGSSQKNSGVTRTVIMQWTGTSWKIVASPNIGFNRNDLMGVAALSAQNIWTVGAYENRSGLYQTLIEHYC